jgi:hypothetical protein
MKIKENNIKRFSGQQVEGRRSIIDFKTVVDPSNLLQV